MATGSEITGSDLDKVGQFTVTLSSVGNPDRHQDPNRSLPGVRGQRVPVKTHREAAEACRKYIEDNELGGGNWSGGDIRSEGNLVARVSYNGRVWHPDEDVDEPVAKTNERPRG